MYFPPGSAHEKLELQAKVARAQKLKAIEVAAAVDTSPAEEVLGYLLLCPMMVIGLNELSDKDFMTLCYRLRILMKQRQAMRRRERPIDY